MKIYFFLQCTWSDWTPESTRQNFLLVLRAQRPDWHWRAGLQGEDRDIITSSLGHLETLHTSFWTDTYCFPPRVQLILVWVSAAGLQCESSRAHWFMFTVDPCLAENPCDRLLVGPLQNGRASHDTHFHNSFGGCQRGGAWMRAGSTS